MLIEAASSTDLPAMLALLAANDLPQEGLAPHLSTAFVLHQAGELVGMAALECYAEGALLRSVAVAASMRGKGLGVRLTEAALSYARETEIPVVVLLTTTAPAFFARRGFETITRAEVPASVLQSPEFTHLCPDSAVVMRLHHPFGQAD